MTKVLIISSVGCCASPSFGTAEEEELLLPMHHHNKACKIHGTRLKVCSPLSVVVCTSALIEFYFSSISHHRVRFKTFVVSYFTVFHFFLSLNPSSTEPRMREKNGASALLFLLMLSMWPSTPAAQSVLLVDMRTIEEHAQGAPVCAFNLPYDFDQFQGEPSSAWIADVFLAAAQQVTLTPTPNPRAEPELRIIMMASSSSIHYSVSSALHNIFHHLSFSFSPSPILLHSVRGPRPSRPITGGAVVVDRPRRCLSKVETCCISERHLGRERELKYIQTVLLRQTTSTPSRHQL